MRRRGRVSVYRGRLTRNAAMDALSDRALPPINVEDVKANWADADDERLLSIAREILSDISNQSDRAVNLRAAFREVVKERGLKL